VTRHPPSANSMGRMCSRKQQTPVERVLARFMDLNERPNHLAIGVKAQSRQKSLDRSDASAV
jgi:hypothetical protein